MKIDQRLNLVIPIETNDGRTLYAHSTPFSEEFFDQHWLLIGKVFSGIYSEGLGPMAGPRLAAKMLKHISIQIESEPGRQGTGMGANAVLAEVRRLTTVITPDGSVLLQEAIDKGLIDKTDKGTLENAIVFFIVVSAMHQRRTLEETMQSVCGLWNAQMSSLNSTDFADSLRKSTKPVNTGEPQPQETDTPRAAALSVPS